jgi:hypothetical protein
MRRRRRRRPHSYSLIHKMRVTLLLHTCPFAQCATAPLPLSGTAPVRRPRHSLPAPKTASARNAGASKPAGPAPQSARRQPCYLHSQAQRIPDTCCGTQSRAWPPSGHISADQSGCCFPPLDTEHTLAQLCASPPPRRHAWTAWTLASPRRGAGQLRARRSSPLHALALARPELMPPICHLPAPQASLADSPPHALGSKQSPRSSHDHGDAN